MGKAEHYVEQYLVDEMKKLGGKCYKMDANLYEGIADRLTVFPNGKMAFVETKQWKGVISPKQKEFQRDMQGMKQVSVVIKSRKGVDAFIDIMMA